MRILLVTGKGGVGKSRSDNGKHNISLSRALAKLEIDSAQYVDDRLPIAFTPDLAGESAGANAMPAVFKNMTWQNLLTRLGSK